MSGDRINQRLRPAPGSKACDDPRPASGAKSGTQGRIAGQPLDRPGKRRWILRRHKKPVLPVGDQLGDAARVGADGGGFTGHSLHQGDAQRLGIAGKDKRVGVQDLIAHRRLVDGAQKADMIAKVEAADLLLKDLPKPSAARVILARDIERDLGATVQQQPDGLHQVLVPFDDVQPTTREQSDRFARLDRDVGRIAPQSVDIDTHRLQQDAAGQAFGHFGPHLGDEPVSDDRGESRPFPLETLARAIILQRAMQGERVGGSAHVPGKGGNQGGTPAGMGMNMGDAAGLARPDQPDRGRGGKGQIAQKRTRLLAGVVQNAPERQARQGSKGIQRRYLAEVFGTFNGGLRPIMSYKPLGRRTGGKQGDASAALLKLVDFAPEKHVGLAGELRHEVAEFDRLLGHGVRHVANSSFRPLRAGAAKVRGMFGAVKAKPGAGDEDGQRTVADMLSVIIPASNEAALIGGCLKALVASDDPAVPVEVIVVANGCADATVAVAEAARAGVEARGWRFEVIDRAEAGKLAALNAGDLFATPGGMRAYVDADVTVSPELLGQIAAALIGSAPTYASGQVRIIGGPSFTSRAYARLWARVPFMKNSVPGCGFFAVNAAGRARWEEFPQVISDDIYARLQFAPAERHQVPASYEWPIADGFDRLVKVRRRQDAGVAEINRLYPALRAHEDKGRMGLSGAVRLALRDPVGFAVYFAVAIRVRMARQGNDWSRSR